MCYILEVIVLFALYVRDEGIKRSFNGTPQKYKKGVKFVVWESLWVFVYMDGGLCFITRYPH